MRSLTWQNKVQESYYFYSVRTITISIAVFDLDIND